MKYVKPPLTLEQQADLLIQRGMADNRSLMIRRLSSVNYYRLSGYWFPFHNSDDTFRSGTSFDLVWERYAFDRRLRLLVMDAIERIEIAVRTQLAYHHGLAYGPFGYAENPSSLLKLGQGAHKDFLQRLSDETGRSREMFVEHFRAKYGSDHAELPVWMVTEVMTFGSVLTFFNGSPHRIKQGIASIFGMPERVFGSWLLALNAVRNICAHHGRLWSRELGVKPLIPLAEDYPEWHHPIEIRRERVFAILSICRYCLARIAPQSRWDERLRLMLDGSPLIPLASMGFPNGWEESPIWKSET